MKKILTTCLAIAVFALTGMVSIGSVSAETNEVEASSGELSTAYDQVKEQGGIINVTNDVTITSELVMDTASDITINIAEDKKITVSGSYGITLKKGKLTITGAGSIEANNGIAVRTLGSNATTNGVAHSDLTIDSDVTITGKIPVSVSCGDTANDVSYGQFVTIRGKLAGTEQALNINGQIKNTADAPVITVEDSAVLTSSNSMGIYAAGYSKLTVNKASITGKESGIGIKAGAVVLNGTTVKATGTESNNPGVNGNGMNSSGAAIQIESNSAYSEGGISLTINGGTYESEQGLAIVEYGDDEESHVTSASVEDATFISGDEEAVLSVSESFPTNFIKSGKFLIPDGEEGQKAATIDPKYIAEGSTVGSDGSIVAPQPTTSTTVTGKGDDTTNPKTGDNGMLYILISVLGLAGIGYTTRKVFSK